ncbi:BPI fold-containing family B member 6 [Malaclemys terrapin pileata]|uniref:BPI fold-containing family B member 6 n=1 Tax=Malaclemys terrapin pileata TaxID=2991368 RepID=UPI0023A84B46|nr:BPI fold-containing family B member 6 [Malaclemys terrapin pileata]
MTESDILQKLAAAAAKKQPGVKPIKGISSFIGANMEITVVANMTAKNKLSQDDLGCPKFSVGDCQISLVSVKTNLPSSMLPEIVNKFLVTTLQKVLPDLLCPAVDAVLTLVNQKFTTLVSPSSVGDAGSIRYALLSPPVTREDFIELDLNTTVLHEGGDLIDLPTDPPALTSLPPKMDSATQLALSVNFLSAELTLLQTSLNLDVTETTLSESLPPSQPMVIEIRITQRPVLTMQQDKGLVHLFGTAEFLTSQPDAAQESLFVLNIHINLGTQFSLQEEKLRISLALDRSDVC